jgi:hypothetical protein
MSDGLVLPLIMEVALDLQRLYHSEFGSGLRQGIVGTRLPIAIEPGLTRSLHLEIDTREPLPSDVPFLPHSPDRTALELYLIACLAQSVGGLMSLAVESTLRNAVMEAEDCRELTFFDEELKVYRVKPEEITLVLEDYLFSGGSNFHHIDFDLYKVDLGSTRASIRTFIRGAAAAGILAALVAAGDASAAARQFAPPVERPAQTVSLVGDAAEIGGSLLKKLWPEGLSIGFRNSQQGYCSPPNKISLTRSRASRFTERREPRSPRQFLPR